MKKFIIIDGNALVHRAFHALPLLTTKDGKVVNAVYGFATILLKVLKDLKPDYLAFTFDIAKKTFRDELYPEYKATRAKQPQELYDQIPIIKQMAQAFGMTIFEKEGFEADDVIGTLCKKPEVDTAEIETIIVTGDLDTLQLVDKNTKVLTLRRGLSDTYIYDEAAVKERYGLSPSQIIDFKALKGDPSDNIPGVKGIGEKTAAELIQKHGSLEILYEHAGAGDVGIKPKVAELLRRNQDQALLSKKLVTIITHVPLEFQLKECELKPYDRSQVVQLFSELEFNSLIPRLPELGEISQTQGALFKFDNLKKKYQYHLVDTEKKLGDFLKALKKKKRFTFDTETTSLDTLTADLLGISFSWKQGEAFFVLWNSKALSALQPIFEDENIAKSGHNMKFDYKVLRHQGIYVRGMSCDTMLASYLLSPTGRAHNLDSLSLSEFQHEKVSFEEMYTSGSLLAQDAEDITLCMDAKDGGKQAIPVDFLSLYSSEDADYTERLYDRFQPSLEKNGVMDVFNSIEMPLVPILAEMEMVGVKVDEKFLKKLSQKIERLQGDLDEKIYNISQKHFNIDSPMQLKEVLFSDLKLSTKGLGKIKTGISTAASELLKLRDLHPIIELILQHRELAKLQSTYTHSLIKLIHPVTGRVHTSFHQTITATGRLSSSDPNLQNIPVRTELGREIRKAFVAEPGYKIVSCDYSQVELRIVAHMAEDEELIRIFHAGKDVHSATAAKIYQVPLEKVTKEMRTAAKTVNFGVLYGQGPWALADQTHMNFNEAKDFIQQYFAVFAGVKRFIEQAKAKAFQLGYAETMSGRRRYLPDLYSGVQQLRAAAERMAVNTPVQGTAADMMKTAMIQVHEQLKLENHNSSAKKSKKHGKHGTLPLARMLLQVHDELVLEVKEESLNQITTMVKNTMENAMKLKVPLKVDVASGNNWGEV